MNGFAYLSFLFKRAGQAVLVLLLVYVFTFYILSVLPGDPVTNMLDSPENNFSEKDKRLLIDYYGLDRPVIVQLGISLWRFIHGNLGISYRTNVPVGTTLANALPSTLALAGVGLMVALGLAFLLAFGSQHLPARVAQVLRGFPSLFLSVPNFLIGLLFFQVFAFGLGWFLIIEPESLAATIFAGIALGIPVSAQIAQVLIATLDQIRQQNFIEVARARGLSSTLIFFTHLLKPSALPVLTVTAVAVGELLGGSVITETVFGRSGIGTVVQQAVTQQDVPILQATVVLSALIFVLITLGTDLLYPLLDPRLKPSVPTPYLSKYLSKGASL